MDQELSDDEGKHDGYDGSLNTSTGSSLPSISYLRSSSSLGSLSSSLGSLSSSLSSSLGSSVILPLRSPSELGGPSSASSTLSTRSAPEPAVNLQPSAAGLHTIMGMFDALETLNPMAGHTYTRQGLEERKEDTPAATPTPTPTLVGVEQVTDRDLMFDALNVIKQRFNLSKQAKKHEVLAEIRHRPNSEAAKCLAALQHFAKNPSSSVADVGKTRSQIQEKWMRGHLKEKYPQKETRGRPKSNR